MVKSAHLEDQDDDLICWNALGDPEKRTELRRAYRRMQKRRPPYDDAEVIEFKIIIPEDRLPCNHKSKAECYLSGDSCYLNS